MGKFSSDYFRGNQGWSVQDLVEGVYESGLALVNNENVYDVSKFKYPIQVRIPWLGLPFDMWSKINKVIDVHLANHKRPSCKTKLNPEKIEEVYLELKDSRNTH